MATTVTKAPMASATFGSRFTATVKQRGKKVFEAVRTPQTHQNIWIQKQLYNNLKQFHYLKLKCKSQSLFGLFITVHYNVTICVENATSVQGLLYNHRFQSNYLSIKLCINRTIYQLLIGCSVINCSTWPLGPRLWVTAVRISFTNPLSLVLISFTNSTLTGADILH